MHFCGCEFSVTMNDTIGNVVGAVKILYFTGKLNYKMYLLKLCPSTCP